MRTLLHIVFGLALLGLAALVAIIFVPVQRTAPVAAPPEGWAPAEGQGEYAMRLADCSACHTAEGGALFAGGRPIESPVGTIYSTNITPDRTGIAGWSLGEFRAALYDGLRPDGAHLYPAMPYENYRRITEQDVQALYAYFMEEVEPVEKPNRAAELPFPFDQRWSLRVWKWLALGEAGPKIEAADAVLARGEYIVEGAGHCGACHSPRNVMMAQPALDATDDAFLSGGEIAGWTAPPLRGPDSAVRGWTVEDIAAILGTGRNAHAATNGEMQLVVRDSTQFLTPDDLTAVATYLASLNEGKRPEPRETETEALLASASPDMPLGARLFLDNCNACHFVDGRGADGVFPELDGNSLVTAESPAGLVSMILEGSELPSTADRPYSLRMPGFGHRLDDAEVAALASFLRAAWSNGAGAVGADAVAERRRILTERAAD